MDFELTAEQELLRSTTRELLTRSYDIERLNKVAETELGWSREVWTRLAEIGILGMGSGSEDAGQVEIHLVLNELGRSLAPEPVVHAALIPGQLLAEVGDERHRPLLDQVDSGRCLLALAHEEPVRRLRNEELATHAHPDGPRWRLEGRKHLVFAGDCADRLIVSAVQPDGTLGLFDVDARATVRHPYRTFDGRRGAHIDLDGVAADLLVQGHEAGAAMSRARVRVNAALCAEAVGAMESALELTTEYLKSRKQFGVTLSKFQALTQRAADMYVSLELARSMSLYASLSIAEGNFDPIIAARAALQIVRSGRHIGQEAIQLHGAIGMTAEYPVGHYTTRLTAIEQALGSADSHLRALITAIDTDTNLTA